MQVIVLDSGPLAIITQRRGVASADECRAWLTTHLRRGVRAIVPEIADYEVRRELHRAGKLTSLSRLDAFSAAVAGRYLPIFTQAMRLAAQMWADLRRRGLPTADPKELDADVILCAQALTLGIAPSELVVATTNVGHLSRMVVSAEWRTI